MARFVLLPCSCGKIHKMKDPERNIKTRCKISGKVLGYEQAEGDSYRLRGENRDYILGKPEISIGRLSSNDIIVERGGLSRKQCILRMVDDAYTVEDLGSSNGTYVNEKRCEPNTQVPLVGGDLLRVADVMLRYIVPEPDETGEEELASDAMEKTRAEAAQAAAADGMEVAADSGSPDDDDPMVGMDLGDYKVLSLMSQGGMGRVYRAEQVATGRECVIKTIIPEMAGSRKIMQRFQREIDMSARIVHPNVPEFFGTGEIGEMVYIAMEFCAGKDLKQWFRRRPAKPKAALVVGRQVAAALAAAHAQNVVHRDIKPDNILLTEKGQVKVIDFGIAKACDDPDVASITMSGSMLGTPRYMAPEQIEDARFITPAADIYSLGAVLYFCLTSHPPRQGKNVLQLMRTFDDPVESVRVKRPDVPEQLDQAILRALEVDPDQRIATAEEMIAALADVPV